MAKFVEKTKIKEKRPREWTIFKSIICLFLLNCNDECEDNKLSIFFQKSRGTTKILIFYDTISSCLQLSAIFKKNTYCCELNGEWEIKKNIRRERTTLEKKH